MGPISINSSRELSRRDLYALFAAATVGATIYLIASAITYRVGFPLDDSWIHLTYARNLALRGQWAFQPEHLSAGSTAPLWTFLLAIGFWLHLGPYVWTYLLGELSLLGLALVVEFGARRLIASYRPAWPWIGLFFVSEWHLQWAALSGMETLLQALLMTTVLLMLMMGTRRYLVLGILTGVSIWVRPDGLTLLGPVVVTSLLVEKGMAGRTSALVRYLLGFGALLAPYLAFNLWLSGAPMPNTFYAKQAEYAAWQAQPLISRLAILMVQLLPGRQDLTIDYACLRGLSATLRESNWRVTVSVWQDKEVIRVEPGYTDALYGAAVDIGTTTMALYVCDLETGKIVATESEMNPQIVYGEDVMSRIQYTIANTDGLRTLHKAVIRALNQMLTQAAQTARISPRDIQELVVVGNTTMHHLFLNLPPQRLGHAPFAASVYRSLDIKARELGLVMGESGNVHVLPTIAAFIGADTTGVLLAEEPHKQSENWLIMDIGTNAEVVLGNERRLMCASTPTGPALEGAHIEHGMRAAPGAIERVEIDAASLEPRYRIIGEQDWNGGRPKGICGSAVLDAVAEMFRVGIIDAGGKFRDDLRPTPRLRSGHTGMEYVIAFASETSIGSDLVVTQKDIRQIQLAKGALYVAARTLLKQFGLQSPDKILLAGAFGMYIDKKNALAIGMLPGCPPENIFAVGNSAGDGARIALLNVEKRREASEIAARVVRYELPNDPDFQEQFIRSLRFPEGQTTGSNKT